ncbi:MAG TPA: hypothetical protein VHM30_00160, partial [Gemmatimonadaceae bacterium]|nr:hypothetical protein [Gemmatimonadaceae bacterium]
WLPGWAYLAQPPERRPPLPLLAIVGIANGMYYALQLALGLDNVNRVQMISLAPLDPARDYLIPVRLALFSWIALLVGHWYARRILRPKPVRLGSGMSALTLREWSVRFVVGGIALDFLTQALPIPVMLRGLLRFALMLAQFGIAALIVLEVRGRLNTRHRVVLGAGIVSTLLLGIGTGSIGTSVFAALSALLALWVATQRVRAWWIAVGLAAAALFVALRGVAIDYRRLAWFSGQELPVTQRSQVILGLLAERVERDGVDGALLHGWESVSTRSANLDLFADVVRRTPRDVPYWNGETYLSLVGAAVPRFLWPNKPQKQLGQAFGHRYDYLSDRDVSTSINLPYFVELYCNFGATGVIVGMFVIGLIYAALEQRLNAPGQRVIVSLCGIVLLVPLLNIESDFSLVFGGLILNCAALWLAVTYIERLSAAKGARVTASMRPLQPTSAVR